MSFSSALHKNHVLCKKKFVPIQIIFIKPLAFFGKTCYNLGVIQNCNNAQKEKGDEIIGKKTKPITDEGGNY